MSRGRARVDSARSRAHACLCASSVGVPRCPLRPGRRRRCRNGSWCRACREALVSLRIGYAEENAICERRASGGGGWAPQTGNLFPVWDVGNFFFGLCPFPFFFFSVPQVSLSQALA